MRLGGTAEAGGGKGRPGAGEAQALRGDWGGGRGAGREAWAGARGGSLSGGGGRGAAGLDALRRPRFDDSSIQR